MKSSVYISGGISGVPEHRQNFKVAQAWLRQNGYRPLNPLTIPACEDDSCDGALVALTEFRHSWACYMRHDIIGMLTCDVIGMIPGWEASPGARLEQYVALSCGLGILYLPTPAQMAEALGVSAP